jgi:histidinol-phosphate/aromatic aminotransferase/cobyric acid decarboxylase-like protein
MLKPNPTVASMAAYALPDISAAEGVEAIVLAQNEHAFPPSAAVQQAVSEAIATEFLRQHGLVVRPMGGYGLPGCLRITIGTAVQMQSTASVLAKWKEGIDG